MAYYPIIGADTAEKRRQALLAAEEEDMTNYTQDDFNQDWEFKIVWSDTAAFRRPEVLNRLLVRADAHCFWDVCSWSGEHCTQRGAYTL